jgi:hypothetical protein
VHRAKPEANVEAISKGDVIVEAAHAPSLNRAAAAALLQIVLEAADHDDVSGEGSDRSVQS